MAGHPVTALQQEDIIVWFWQTSRLSEPPLDAALAVMSDDEKARMQRLHLQATQQQYALSRLLLRNALSRYAAVEPQVWRFKIAEGGKPQIDTPAVPLHFSLAHTTDAIAVAIRTHMPVGVDVENHQRRTSSLLGMAQRFYSAAEYQKLRNMPAYDCRRDFFQLWTLKEAYLKARGIGLTVKLSAVGFEILDFTSNIRAVFAPELQDDPAAWWFGGREPSPQHCLAVATPCTNSNLRLELHHFDARTA